MGYSPISSCSILKHTLLRELVFSLLCRKYKLFTLFIITVYKTKHYLPPSAPYSKCGCSSIVGESQFHVCHRHSSSIFIGCPSPNTYKQHKTYLPSCFTSEPTVSNQQASSAIAQPGFGDREVTWVLGIGSPQRFPWAEPDEWLASKQPDMQSADAKRNPSQLQSPKL